jgi:hypothetical protein
VCLDSQSLPGPAFCQDNPSEDAIIKELATMKKRIEDLEAQLKAAHAQSVPAASAQPELAAQPAVAAQPPAITNPGRYLVLLPPINGATAFSGTPYFTENPGDKFRASDASATFDYMPRQFITFRWEYSHRDSNVPYSSGAGGVTPPEGNTGSPGSFVPGFTPDLRKYGRRLIIALLVKL